jgi:hypothetical protein
MKKTLFYLTIFSLILIFFPFNHSKAVTQDQINSEVQIVCPDNYGNWFSGSGTIIDPKGIILTNRHVVTDEKGETINTCFIGFIKSINDEPNFGTKENPNLAQVKFTTVTDDMDSALLYLENKNNAVYPSINIWGSDSSKLKFGEKIEVIGYPGIGGSTITYTSGDFSGFGNKSDGTNNYIKTTAPLEHGNSGGASYSSTGDFIGIPTMVVAGSLNSLSYILSINSIKNWLSGVLGNTYKDQIITQKPDITKPSIDIQNDITPPDISKISLQFYDCSKFYPEKDSAGQVQPYPTINGVKGDSGTRLNPENCIPILYDVNKSFNYQPQTLYVKLNMPDYVKSDVFTVGWMWSKEVQVDPLKKALQFNTIAPGTAYTEFSYPEVFFRPFPFLGNIENGTINFSLQVSDKSGNVSDTKIWKYNYGLTEIIKLITFLQENRQEKFSSK